MALPDQLQVLLVALFFSFVILKARAQHKRGMRAVILAGWRDCVLLAAFFCWFGAVLINALAQQPVFGRPRLFESEPITAAGMALGIAGLALFGAALLHMGRSWHIGIDEQADDALVTSGVYAWSRHPIYVFVNLFAWSTFLMNGLMNGTLFFAITAVCISLGVHLRMLEEERFLQSKYGAAHGAYVANVQRYFGRKS